MKLILGNNSISNSFCSISVASDLATPSESTFATDLLLDDPRVVSPAATEELASIHSLTGGVASSSLRTQRARFSVRLAEVGRVLAVNQIESVRWLDGRPLGDEAVPVVARYHLGRAVERLFQPVPHVPERWHFPPTGSNRARSGETVTLAFRAHKLPDGLSVVVYRRTRRRERKKQKTEVVVGAKLLESWTDEKGRKCLRTKRPALLLCSLTRVLMSLRFR